MSTSCPSDPSGGGLSSATLPHSTFQWQASSDVVLLTPGALQRSSPAIESRQVTRTGE